MHIYLGQDRVFSRRYDSFEEISSDHIEYETRQGRLVPNFNYDDWIRELVFFVLMLAINEIQNRRDVERRHKELLAKLDEFGSDKHASGHSLQNVNSEEGASALFAWAEENGIDISVSTETEVEMEIWDAFQEMTRSSSIIVKCKD